MSKRVILSALVAIGAVTGSTHIAHARTLSFMNSQGYQMQLAASRKAYADAVAAQQAPHVIHRSARKKKPAAKQ